MKVFISLILLTIFFQMTFIGISSQTFAQAKDESKNKGVYQIVGKFVKPSKKLNLPYEYYFVYSNSKGQKMAFPLKNKSSLNLDNVDFSQNYHINVRDSQKLVDVGESKKKVRVLEMVEGKVFNMKDLSYAAKQVPETDPAPKMPNDKTPHHPMFRINDNVANSAIFTAGAVLLGSMLLAK